MNEPHIAAETPFYIVADKPHNMHTAPLDAKNSKENKEGDTLLDWCARFYPEVTAVRGKKPVEGGLLHRLDYETAGLVLVARTQAAYDFLAAEQDAGHFTKEYTAVTRPLPPDALTVWRTIPIPLPGITGIVESAFRHYGPGRKLVKPETDAPLHPRAVGQYCTHVLEMEEHGADVVVRVRLTRGFRHQIRAHLAWIGYPINNDTRYGGANSGGPLELTARRLTFPDPANQTARRLVCIEQPLAGN
jgi:23S rRNA pseudouridine1911/1915/1917 synthase